MKDKNFFQIHANVCRAVTNPIRLEIIYTLHGGEKKVTQLAETLQVPVGTISQHLGIMRVYGVVVQRREAQHVYYRLSSPRIIAAYEQMRQFTLEYLTSQSEIITSER